MCKNMFRNFHVEELAKTVHGVLCTLSAYCGLFYPYLAYAVPIWEIKNHDTHLLFRLQKKVMRDILSLKNTDHLEDSLYILMLSHIINLVKFQQMIIRLIIGIKNREALLC